MQKKISLKINRMVGIAIFIAIIIVLQSIGSFIKFGSFSISLVLVPIAVGAAIYGEMAGAIFGATFGAVVLFNCINGADIGGNMLWVSNPAVTSILCMGKGMLAGLFAGLAYTTVSKLTKKPYIGAICAAFVCPVVNTGIFLAGMAIFFHDTLTIWAGGSNIIYYTFIGLAGVNFILELSVNIVLSPVIVRILNVLQKK